METDASPSHSYLWDLPTTARQSVHVEKGVPGCYGEVRGGYLRGFGDGSSKAQTRVLFPALVLFLQACKDLICDDGVGGAVLPLVLFKES